MSEFAAHAPLILQKDSHEVSTRTNRDQKALQVSSRDILQLRHSNTDSFHHLWPVPVCEGPLVYLRGALPQPFMSETCLAFQTVGSLCAWLGGAKIRPSQILVYLRLGAKAQRRAPEARAFHIVILVLFTGFVAVVVVALINSGRGERAFQPLPALTSTRWVARLSDSARLFLLSVCAAQNGKTHALLSSHFPLRLRFKLFCLRKFGCTSHQWPIISLAFIWVFLERAARHSLIHLHIFLCSICFIQNS